MAEITRENGTMLCRFEGRLDTATCPAVEEELQAALAEPPTRAVFDMADVDYVSSAFLKVCVKVAKQLGSENLALTHMQPHVKKIFKIAGFDKLMAIE
jgi:anti-sigma B factor antagonist